MASSSEFKIKVDLEINGTQAQQAINGALKTTLSDTKSITNETKKLGQSWGDAAAKFLKWQIIGDIQHGIINGIQDMLDNVFKLDTALTEFNRVSDLSTEDLAKFTDQAYKAGEAVGRTGTAMVEAATEFAKAGYDEFASLKLAETAALFQNIADSELSAADASSFIISQIKAFNITAENSIHIIDAVNEVSNKFAVSSTDLQSAMTKSGTALGTLGNSFEESIALVTAG